MDPYLFLSLGNRGCRISTPGVMISVDSRRRPPIRWRPVRAGPTSAHSSRRIGKAFQRPTFASRAHPHTRSFSRYTTSFRLSLLKRIWDWVWGFGPDLCSATPEGEAPQPPVRKRVVTDLFGGFLSSATCSTKVKEGFPSLGLTCIP